MRKHVILAALLTTDRGTGGGAGTRAPSRSAHSSSSPITTRASEPPTNERIATAAVAGWAIS